MKCANCKHEKHEGVCRVMVVDPTETTRHGAYVDNPCGCTAFVEPPDMAVCSNCEQSLSYSYSTAQLVPGFPYLFVCIWCVHCKHIITSQITVMLPPLPKDAAPPKSNLHVPGGPLG